jgi:dihydropteroate synthase
VTPSELQSWLRGGPAAAQRRPLLVGILNLTPDSFSDGGSYQEIAAALARARSMVNAGADLIDIGGESTRPGASAVSAEEQIRRVAPVVAAIRREMPIAMSIDTTKSSVASAALDAGVNWINDISAGLDDPLMFPLAAQRQVPIVLTHMQGTPGTMQINPTYDNVTIEVIHFLRQRLDSAKTAGIDSADVLLDPGIGFGKTVEHNLQLLRELNQIVAIGRPVVVGTSRKGFIGTITGETGARLMGTAATVAWAVAQGAAVMRVHDVDAMGAVVRMVQAIRLTKPETRNQKSE